MTRLMTQVEPTAAAGSNAVVTPERLSKEELGAIDAYWRACTYLAAGMIYLRANPLLREPLKPEHVKERLLGHWGTSPGLSFVYVHLNRLINKYDLDAVFLAGPGHGAPGVLAPVYLEGTYSEVYPNKGEDEEGMREFFKEFSFPGGIGSHCTPETPGSIHEGGELGYSISHAFGAAFDNPDLLVAVVVGDGEAETGPLATSWHSNKFLNPIRDGAVLPILHLNGYKINNPTLLARISREELVDLFKGYGWTPHCRGRRRSSSAMHQSMAATLEDCVLEIRRIQQEARASGNASRARWPMIVLRTPKGWTGPKEVDGHKVEGFWRAHQVPLAGVRENPAHLKQLEDWLRSYRPDELFDGEGRLIPELKALAPSGTRRMSANPHANGGLLRKPLRMPDFRDYAIEVDKPGQTTAENTRPLGRFLRDIMRQNMTNFRVFGPDETASNKLDAIYEVEQEAVAGRVPAGGRRRRRAVAGRSRPRNALRAHAGGLVRRLSAQRPARVLLDVRGVRPRHRLDVQPAREVAGHLPRAVLAGAGVLAQSAHDLDGVAPGPQRLHAPGPRIHRPGAEQEPRRVPRLPAARREFPALRGRSLSQEHQLHQRDRLGQAEAPAVPDHGRRPSNTAPRASASGPRRATTRARSRMW